MGKKNPRSCNSSYFDEAGNLCKHHFGCCIEGSFIGMADLPHLLKGNPTVVVAF